MLEQWEPMAMEWRRAAGLMERARSMSADEWDAIGRIVEQRRAAPMTAAPWIQRPDGTAIINIGGVLAPAATFWGTIFGDETTHDGIRAALEETITSAAVKRVVLNISSPGGLAFGLERLAEDVRAFGAIKPIYAYTESIMASAAYFIGSQSAAVYVAPDGMVGSIGAALIIPDYSEAYKRLGVMVNVLTSDAPIKAAGVPGTRLTAQQREALQREVDAYGRTFRAAVQSARSLSGRRLSEVSTGEMFVGAAAVEMGLADRVGTLNEVLPIVASVASGGRAQMDAVAR